MYLDVLKYQQMFYWSFLRLNKSKKGLINAFRGYNLTGKVSRMYLEIKLQQSKFHWCLYISKCNK